MSDPLVTVVCLCYNHARWVKQAIDSVLNQTYKNIQIIVIDDASTDGSQKLIGEYTELHQRIEIILNESNIGNCRTFNSVLSRVKGSYVVDFSTDDIMMPDRLEKQVTFFEGQPADVGVVFSDATYIDEIGNSLYNFYERLLANGDIARIPVGDVFADVIGTYFISAPTMIIRKVVLDRLQGYDETLAYEDFDFWIRSAREFRYAFINERLTKVRRHPESLSRKIYSAGDRQLESTLRVCHKITRLMRTVSERQALIKRLKYEHRHAVLTDHISLADEFYKLLKQLDGNHLSDRVLHMMNHIPIAKKRLRDRLRRS